MSDHPVPGIRNQRGPVATCRQAGCGREVRWSVMQDEWQHTYTVAEHQRRQAAATESMIQFMRGLAGDLERNAPGYFVTPDQVERWLRR